jgi:hypothetical protein
MAVNEILKRPVIQKFTTIALALSVNSLLASGLEETFRIRRTMPARGYIGISWMAIRTVKK